MQSNQKSNDWKVDVGDTCSVSLGSKSIKGPEKISDWTPLFGHKGNETSLLQTNPVRKCLWFPEFSPKLKQRGTVPMIPHTHPHLWPKAWAFNKPTRQSSLRGVCLQVRVMYVRVFEPGFRGRQRVRWLLCSGRSASVPKAAKYFK